MIRIWKITTIMLAFALMIFIGIDQGKTNENEAFYKSKLFDYTLSARDAVSLIAKEAGKAGDNRVLQKNLGISLDRIERLIYQSNHYLYFDYQTAVFRSLSLEFDEMFDDGVLEGEELERIKVIEEGFNLLIQGIRNKEEEDEQVNQKLSVEEINVHVEAFVLRMD